MTICVPVRIAHTFDSMPATRGLAVVATAVAFALASVHAEFVKPNPLPDNYLEWTATVYSDGDGLTTYKGSTDEDLVLWFDTGKQDLWQMYDSATWKTCDFSYATQLLAPVSAAGEYTELRLKLNTLKAGTYYLACGVGSHCDVGQKLVLTLTENPLCNQPTGWNAFVGGGASNQATGDWATIGAGFGNRATGLSSVVVGGISNKVVSNYGTVVGGYKNLASSRFATVLGGGRNTAKGRYSVTAGYNARTTKDYSAAFAFNGDEGCLVETSKTVGFCAKHFYLNDVDILATFNPVRQLSESRDEHLAAVSEIRKTVDANQERLDSLAGAAELQQRASDALERIEAQLAVAGVDVSAL